MSRSDVEDLIAYLKRLGQELDPGLTRTTIRVGTLIPGEGPLRGVGAAIEGLLGAYFRELNARGGVYGRTVALVTHSLPAGRERALGSVKSWLAEENLFLLVGTFTPGLELEMQRLLADTNIPVIGPFTLRPVQSYSLNRNVFYLHAGLGDQVRALLRFAEKKRAVGSRVALLHPDDAPYDEVLRAAELACRQHGWPAPISHAYSPGKTDAGPSVRWLQEHGVDLVVHLGVEPEIRGFLEEAARGGWSPPVLASGALAGRLVQDLPPAFRRRLYLAYPTLPEDRKPWALEELSRLLAGDEEPVAHVQAVTSSFSAARLTEEALRQAGRALSREGLTRFLEGLYLFDTGLSPPLTYTPNRRIGASGSYVIEVDPTASDRAGRPRRIEWVEIY